MFSLEYNYSDSYFLPIRQQTFLPVVIILMAIDWVCERRVGHGWRIWRIDEAQ